MTTEPTVNALSSPMMPQWVKVQDIERNTHDTFTITLSPPQGWGGFRPGQFNMLYVFGVGEVPISLSGDPERNDVLVHTIRAVGSVTNALARLVVGDVVGVRGPFGTCWPVEELRDKDVVLVSGGIGLAPLRPVLYALAHERADFGRVTLLHGARTPSDLLYSAQLDRWAPADSLQSWVTVDRSEESWSGNVGLVTSLFPRVELDPTGTVGLICGPEIMMRFVVREFEQRGVPPENLYVSLERNMQCAIGMCGHCQMGPHFLCTDGPVFRYDRVASLLSVREV